MNSRRSGFLYEGGDPPLPLRSSSQSPPSSSSNGSSSSQSDPGDGEDLIGWAARRARMQARIAAARWDALRRRALRRRSALIAACALALAVAGAAAAGFLLAGGLGGLAEWSERGHAALLGFPAHRLRPHELPCTLDLRNISAAAAPRWSLDVAPGSHSSEVLCGPSYAEIASIERPGGRLGVDVEEIEAAVRSWDLGCYFRADLSRRQVRYGYEVPSLPVHGSEYVSLLCYDEAVAPALAETDTPLYGVLMLLRSRLRVTEAAPLALQVAAASDGAAAAAAHPMAQHPSAAFVADSLLPEDDAGSGAGTGGAGGRRLPPPSLLLFVVEGVDSMTLQTRLPSAFGGIDDMNGAGSYSAFSMPLVAPHRQNASPMDTLLCSRPLSGGSAAAAGCLWQAARRVGYGTAHFAFRRDDALGLRYQLTGLAGADCVSGHSCPAHRAAVGVHRYAYFPYLAAADFHFDAAAADARCQCVGRRAAHSFALEYVAAMWAENRRERPVFASCSLYNGTARRASDAHLALGLLDNDLNQLVHSFVQMHEEPTRQLPVLALLATPPAADLGRPGDDDASDRPAMHLWLLVPRRRMASERGLYAPLSDGRLRSARDAFAFLAELMNLE